MAYCLISACIVFTDAERSAVSLSSDLPVDYRQGHSTETALLDVLDSVHTAADSKEVALLICLDLSAAFDTVCTLH